MIRRVIACIALRIFKWSTPARKATAINIGIGVCQPAGSVVVCAMGFEAHLPPAMAMHLADQLRQNAFAAAQKPERPAHEKTFAPSVN